MLRFSPANAKLSRLYNVKELKSYLKNGKIFSFDLLSGFSCGFAHDCHSRAIETPDGLRVKDFSTTKWRCYSAQNESQYTNVYKLRKHNLEMVRKYKTVEDLYKLFSDNLPVASVIRLHSAGDHLNEKYFKAWLKIAQDNPQTLFYWYTKAIPYWVNNKDEVDATPNYIGTASYGGRRDDMIAQYGLRYTKVVFSNYQARKLKLPVDHDDSHACIPSKRYKSFSLLLHSSQPAGSEASKAWQRIKSTVGGYSRKKGIAKQ